MPNEDISFGVLPISGTLTDLSIWGACLVRDDVPGIFLLIRISIQLLVFLVCVWYVISDEKTYRQSSKDSIPTKAA